MITKTERRKTLSVAVPVLAMILAILPFIQTRWVLAICGLVVASTAMTIGMAIATPTIHPNRK